MCIRDRLQRGELEILDTRRCKSPWRTIKPIKGSQVCAVGRNGDETNSCGGDSGGGLVTINNNKETLIGMSCHLCQHFHQSNLCYHCHWCLHFRCCVIWGRPVWEKQQPSLRLHQCDRAHDLDQQHNNIISDTEPGKMWSWPVPVSGWWTLHRNGLEMWRPAGL